MAKLDFTNHISSKDALSKTTIILYKLRMSSVSQGIKPLIFSENDFG